MATRLMTPFCYASLLAATLMADGAFADVFRTGPAAITSRADAPGEMGGMPVGIGDSALGISVELWEAAATAA